MTPSLFISVLAIAASAGMICSGHLFGGLCLLALWAVASGVALGEWRGGR